MLGAVCAILFLYLQVIIFIRLWTGKWPKFPHLPKPHPYKEYWKRQTQEDRVTRMERNIERMDDYAFNLGMFGRVVKVKNTPNGEWWFDKDGNKIWVRK